MFKILVNAYACSPNWGSEPGMAWNWCLNLAKYCELFIITEGEWKNEIEDAIKKHPNGKNMHFFYNPVPEKVRKMCWNQGDWRFYYYYRQWQKKTLTIAKQICCEHKIDIIHQNFLLPLLQRTGAGKQGKSRGTCRFVLSLLPQNQRPYG